MPHRGKRGGGRRAPARSKAATPRARARKSTPAAAQPEETPVEVETAPAPVVAVDSDVELNEGEKLDVDVNVSILEVSEEVCDPRSVADKAVKISCGIEGPSLVPRSKGGEEKGDDEEEEDPEELEQVVVLVDGAEDSAMQTGDGEEDKREEIAAEVREYVMAVQVNEIPQEEEDPEETEECLDEGEQREEIAEELEGIAGEVKGDDLESQVDDEAQEDEEDPEELEHLDGMEETENVDMVQDQEETQAIDVGEALIAAQDEGGAQMGEGDGYKSISDDEEDNDDSDENDEEIDPSAFMHAPLSDRKKQKEFEIFVGGLDKEAVEEDLIKVFGGFGEIQAARIVKHPTTQKSKGFAFIRYATIEQAKKVLDDLKDGIEVRGKRVGISPSQDNDTLYVGNICKTWSKDRVFEKLKSFGIEHIEEIYLPEDSKNEGKFKGFALLEFSSHSDAMAGFQRLRRPDAIFGCDRSAKVAFAQSSMHPSEESLSQVKTVYIEGLPDSWDEEKLKEQCKQYGEIEKTQLSRNFTVVRRKDFGFVTFTSHESAVACVEGINSSQIGEGEMKVKANLARPQNKGRLAKQGARGGFKVRKNVEEAGHSSMSRSHAKSKGGEAKGKGHNSFRGGRGVQSSRPHSRVTGGRGGSGFQERQRREQQFRGGKRGSGGRGGAPQFSPRSSRKPHGNVRGKPPSDFGNQRNSQFGKPKGKHFAKPPPYRDPYAYNAPATSYRSHGYSPGPGSKRQYYDMEPHSGYLGPPAKQVRGSFGYGQTLPGSYDNRASTASGYTGGPVGQPSYPAEYSSYPGYEAGYTYPSGSQAYTPNTGAYPSNNVSYPVSGGAYPPSGGVYPASSGSYPPSVGAYPASSGPYAPSGGAYPSTTGSYPPGSGTYPPQRPYY